MPSRILFVLGRACSGTSVLKKFIGAHPEITELPFPELVPDAPLSGSGAWLDKAVLRMRQLRACNDRYGDSAHYFVIVRDPRATLNSLLECPPNKHAKIPRTDAFWGYWERQYRGCVEELNGLGSRHILLLRYEDLLWHPSEFRLWIADYLGIRRWRFGDIGYTPDRHPDSKLDWDAGEYNAIFGGSLERWRFASADRVRLLMTYDQFEGCRSLMKELGYLDDRVHPLSNHMNVNSWPNTQVFNPTTKWLKAVRWQHRRS